MKKFIYLTVVSIAIISMSSCSKQCVQCQATDQYGVVVNQSNVVCEHDFNRNHFERDYKKEFQGFNPVCGNVSK